MDDPPTGTDARPASSRDAGPDEPSRPGSPTRRYHVGLSGMLYVLTTAFLGIGAFNSQNNLLYAAFGLAIAGLVVSGFIGGAGLMAIRVERLPVGHAEAGGLVPMRYRVRHAGRLIPSFAVSISETPPGRDEEDWTNRLSRPRGFVAHLGPGETLTVEAPAWGLRRGPCRLRGVEIASRFPFGLAGKSIRFEQPAAVLVRPARVRLARLALERAIGVAPSEGSAGRRLGASDEFVGVREYTPGDSLRAIAWKASARTGDLMVRQFAASVPARVRVVLDFDGSEPNSAEGERAVALAAALVREAEREGLAPGLRVRGMGVAIPCGRGAAHVTRILAALSNAGLDAPPGSAGGEAATGATSRERVVLVRCGVGAAPGPGGSARVIHARDLGSMLAPGSSLPAALAGEAVS